MNLTQSLPMKTCRPFWLLTIAAVLATDAALARADDSLPAPASGTAPSASAKQLMGIFMDVKGRVRWRASGTSPWQDAKVNDLVNAGVEVRTGFESRAALRVGKNATVLIDSGSNFVVPHIEQDQGVLHTVAAVKSGRADFKIDHVEDESPDQGKVALENDFRVVTPSTTLAVRGTEFAATHGALGGTEIVGARANTIQAIEVRYVASNASFFMSGGGGESTSTESVQDPVKQAWIESIGPPPVAAMLMSASQIEVSAASSGAAIENTTISGTSGISNQQAAQGSANQMGDIARSDSLRSEAETEHANAVVAASQGQLAYQAAAQQSAFSAIDAESFDDALAEAQLALQSALGSLDDAASWQVESESSLAQSAEDEISAFQRFIGNAETTEALASAQQNSADAFGFAKSAVVAAGWAADASVDCATDAAAADESAASFLVRYGDLATALSRATESHLAALRAVELAQAVHSALAELAQDRPLPRIIANLMVAAQSAAGAVARLQEATQSESLAIGLEAIAANDALRVIDGDANDEWSLAVAAATNAATQALDARLGADVAGARSQFASDAVLAMESVRDEARAAQEQRVLAQEIEADVFGSEGSVAQINDAIASHASSLDSAGAAAQASSLAAIAAENHRGSAQSFAAIAEQFDVLMLALLGDVDLGRSQIGGSFAAMGSQLGAALSQVFAISSQTAADDASLQAALAQGESDLSNSAGEAFALGHSQLAEQQSRADAAASASQLAAATAGDELQIAREAVGHFVGYADSDSVQAQFAEASNLAEVGAAYGETSASSLAAIEALAIAESLGEGAGDDAAAALEAASGVANALTPDDSGTDGDAGSLSAGTSDPDFAATELLALAAAASADAASVSALAATQAGDASAALADEGANQVAAIGGDAFAAGAILSALTHESLAEAQVAADAATTLSIESQTMADEIEEHAVVAQNAHADSQLQMQELSLSGGANGAQIEQFIAAQDASFEYFIAHGLDGSVDDLGGALGPEGLLSGEVDGQVARVQARVDEIAVLSDEATMAQGAVFGGDGFIGQLAEVEANLSNWQAQLAAVETASARVALRLEIAGQVSVMLSELRSAAESLADDLEVNHPAGERVFAALEALHNATAGLQDAESDAVAALLAETATQAQAADMALRLRAIQILSAQIGQDADAAVGLAAAAADVMVGVQEADDLFDQSLELMLEARTYEDVARIARDAAQSAVALISDGSAGHLEVLVSAVAATDGTLIEVTTQSDIAANASLRASEFSAVCGAAAAVAEHELAETVVNFDLQDLLRATVSTHASGAAANRAEIFHQRTINAEGQARDAADTAVELGNLSLVQERIATDALASIVILQGDVEGASLSAATNADASASAAQGAALSAIQLAANARGSEQSRAAAAVATLVSARADTHRAMAQLALTQANEFAAHAGTMAERRVFSAVAAEVVLTGSYSDAAHLSRLAADGATIRAIAAYDEAARLLGILQAPEGSVGGDDRGMGNNSPR